MRLSLQEIKVLKTKLNDLDRNARLYLFGSRIDDQKKGGDIDLLIKSNTFKQADIRKLRLSFFDVFGEQKIDIIVDDGTDDNAFIKKIQQHAIEI